MSGQNGGWVDICRVERLSPDRGACALVAGDQVALFRLGTTGERPPWVYGSVCSSLLIVIGPATLHTVCRGRRGFMEL